ncbi:MAG: hypothetical protein AABW56_02190 [Nanoarchaeota archaeon]
MALPELYYEFLGDYAYLGGFLLAIIIIGIASYIYTALALMAIAQKTKTKNPWLAWIPIANLYLMTQIGKVPWWTILFLILAFIPFLGTIVAVALTIFLWWKIAEARKMEGWLGVLTVIPLVNWIVIGIIAWKK